MMTRSYPYSLYSYGRMIADRARTDAYARALRRVVTPGSVVVDIGAGVGIWALLACQLGARKVYAIDPNDAIHIAREIAVANGYADRIEFIQDLSTRITLPESADVIVSDIHGVLPLFEQSMRSIIDARRRLLSPGGTMIPQQETIWVAVVEAPELYGAHLAPWDEERYGLNLRAGKRIVTNLWCKGRVTAEQLLVKPQCWATLDYVTVDSTDVCARVSWTTTRAATGHGFIAWFDTTLAEGATLSNAPDAPDLIFGNAFFPWSEPVSLAAGDTVHLDLQAKLVSEDYVWRWNTSVLNQARPERLKASFKQSTLCGAVVSPQHLRKLATDYLPELDEDGEIDQFILKLMNNEYTLGNIALQVADRFPTRFKDSLDALTRVGELSAKYSR